MRPNAIINQEKSGNDAVSGYFGMYCGRHDSALKMVEMDKGITKLDITDVSCTLIQSILNKNA